MKFQRVIMILLAALLLPGLALAQTTTRATFNVTKDFTDDNPAAVSVTLNCFTGLPLSQSQDITEESSGVTFVVESFTSGDLDCTVTEDDVTGYTASYPEGDCEFTEVSDGGEYACEITNDPDPVQVTVTKEWVIDGIGGDQVDPTYELWLECDNPIVGGSESYYYGYEKELTPEYGANTTSKKSYTAHVIPDWDGGTDCWVDESVYDSAVEVDDSDCDDNGDIHVVIGGGGNGNACTIINTVFFEGIPTLSQYGMAIMALLMLGVGFVGFRRFV